MPNIWNAQREWQLRPVYAFTDVDGYTATRSTGGREFHLLGEDIQLQHEYGRSKKTSRGKIKKAIDKFVNCICQATDEDKDS